MNEHAQKWVEALRSGEFQQGMGALRKGDSYCCLGVACEVYRRETGDGRWVPTEEHGDEWSRFAIDGYEVFGELPGVVMDWLGLRTSSGRYHEFSSLTQTNDRGATFDRIAATIEHEPDGLFQGETA